MLNLAAVTQDTIAQAALTIGKIRKDLQAGDLSKASIDLATNITGFNLEAPAKLLVPILSPFRQSIARMLIGGKATNWKKITAVSPTGGFFPAEGVKANLFSLTLVDVPATFRSFGRGGNVTWEAEIAGKNYEDARSRAEALLLMQVLKEEELAILFGNRTTLNSGVGPVLSTATSTTGGLLPADTYFIQVKALTGEGIARGTIVRPAAGTNDYDFLAVGTPVEDTSVGYTDVAAAEVSQITTGTTSTVTITWTAIAGAVGYAVYIGLTTGDANLTLQGIVTQSKVVFTTFSTTGPAATQAADTSANALAFDGIVAQLTAAGSGAYVRALNGPLSAAVGRGIPEVDAMIDEIYDRTKQEPDRLVMGWQESKSIDDKLASVANDRVALMVPIAANGELGAQMPRFTTYKSSRGKNIIIEEQVNVPGGMILGLIDSVMYQDSEIPAAWAMHMGSDVTRLDYALTAPQVDFEIRGFGVLAGYAPSLQGIMYDIHEAA